MNWIKLIGQWKKREGFNAIPGSPSQYCRSSTAGIIEMHPAIPASGLVIQRSIKLNQHPANAG
jgi:hypothetical protein